MLEVNSVAPNFSLKDKDGNVHSLTDYKGKRIVLYFYPRDNTPGCTRQACAFGANYSAFEEKDIIVIGISKDSIAAHTRFIDKYNLPFLLLSDPELESIQAYDVWQEKKAYGKVSMGVVRSTFLIDRNGRIEKIMKKVKPDTNAEDVLEYYKNQGE